MTLPKILRDRRVLLAGGVGVAAVIGLVTRRRNGGKDPGPSASAGTVAGLGLPTFDSSGTDAYNNFAAQLAQYGAAISAIQDQLGGVQPPTDTAGSLPVDTVLHRQNPTLPASGTVRSGGSHTIPIGR